LKQNNLNNFKKLFNFFSVRQEIFKYIYVLLKI
jgi:hypothetical protein